MKIVTAEQMRQIDQECARTGVPAHLLMENAGKAVAGETKKIIGDITGKAILVLVGPGNNGRDGLVAARYLHESGARVGVYLCSARPPDDNNLQLVKESNIILFEAAQDENMEKLEGLLKGAETVIDAIFGTGTSRPLRGNFPEILARVNRAKNTRGIRIIAVDLPSGLNADTGAVDPSCPFADYTITLAFPKVGMYIFPGAGHMGTVIIADIGIPSHLAGQITTELITGDWAKSVLPPRPLSANKGTFGKVLVSAGSINYIGAAYLACNGAMRVGAGLTTLATASSLQPVLASRLTETTYIPLPESPPGIISPAGARLVYERFGDFNVLLLGCGLGQMPAAISFVKEVLFRQRTKMPSLVLDADALNTLATVPNWWQQLPDDAILTPHPGEMARLTGKTVEEVQARRFDIIRMASAQWNKTIVLKGAFTFIAAPQGSVRVSPFANAGLASAGTGDVLSGAVAGLLAQGLSLLDAAACGVYIHGLAGEMVKAELGDAGMLASDLLSALPRGIKALKNRLV